MKKQFLMFLLLPIVFSCNPQEDKKQSDDATKAVEASGTVMPPISLKPPKIVRLESMPKPQNIEIPTKAGSSYISRGGTTKETKIELLPPVIIPTSFLSNMRSYTTKEGLALDTILSSLVDRSGNLWFGTWGGGISRYDGKTFTNFTQTHGLSDGSVTSILEDKKGNIWFGMIGGGVIRYDGQSFTNYTKEQGLTNNIILSILEDKTGNFWFGTEEGGISYYDGQSFTHLTKDQGLIDNTVWSMLEDDSGNLWFGTNDGISRYDRKTFTNFTKDQGLANNIVKSMLKDKKGNLWFGTNGGVSHFDGETFTNFTEDQGLSNNIVRSILEDKEGILWFGTYGGGVSRYDGKTFVKYSQEQGLSNNNVTSILEDNTGNLWFSTDGGGASRYDGPAFINYTEKQGLPAKSIHSILQDKAGNLWLGTTGGGVTRYDGKSSTTFTIQQGLPNDIVWCMQEDNLGNLWFGTRGGGVSRFDGKSFTNYTIEQGLLNNFVLDIHKDKEGNLWFASRGGVSKFDGKTFTNFTSEQGLVHNIVFTILEDKIGNLWFGTWGGGVSHFDGNQFTNYTKSQGLADNFITDILEDKMGILWFCTPQGVSRFDGKSFLTYTMKEGLPENKIGKAIVTKEQNILFGTNLGLAVLMGFSNQKISNKFSPQNKLTNEELKKNSQPIFEVYNIKRGYPVSAVSWGQEGMVINKEGIIWIGTVLNETGLVRFDYQALNKNKNPPNVFIQEIKIDNEAISWYDLLETKTKSEVNITPPNTIEEVKTFGSVLSDKERKEMRQKFKGIQFDGITKWYPVPKNLELPHRNNNITFKFAAIEPDYPQDVLYQYKLEGYDKDWSPPTNSTHAIFGNIFEGTYEFKLKAQSPFGVWSEPVLYTFKVLPPWFRTWWAYTIYALSSIAILYLIFRWRTAALRARKEQLEMLYHAAERFIPKRFLQLLNKKHMEDVQLGDSVKREISAMFADIRGFTTIAESLTPERTALFLNTYMHYMEPVIRQNNGFINQFLGDGILATFPENPSDAVDAAVGMIQTLPKFNEEVKTKGFTPVSIGIGINTGEAMVIALGVEERMDASVVSDAINTASRVEGLNKFYKTQLLISESVYQKLTHPEKYLIRMVDKVVLKGKHTGTGIYEVSALPSKKALEKELKYFALFNEAFAKYTKGDFTQAEISFKLCLQQKPTDFIAELLLSRCIEFQKTSAPEGWNGTITLKEK